MKRARYTGASGTGVDLTVTLPDGQIREFHVNHGDLTPSEIVGQPLPDEYVDSLLEQETNWAPEDLGELTVEELAERAKALGIEVTGTGAGGRVVKDDLIAALTPPEPEPDAEPDPDATGEPNPDQSGAGDGAGSQE